MQYLINEEAKCIGQYSNWDAAYVAAQDMGLDNFVIADEPSVNQTKLELFDDFAQNITGLEQATSYEEAKQAQYELARIKSLLL